MDYIKLLEDPNVVFRIAILFTFAQFFWEAYLSYRQRCVYRKNLPMPNILEDRLSDKKFKEAKEYGLATNQFNSLSSAFDQMVQTLFYAMNGLSLFWYGASGLLNGQLGLKDQNIILQGCIFLFFTSIFNFVLLMPWKVYETFVLEAKYGFNKQTPMFFVKDQIKKFFVKEIILQPIMALLVYIINYGGDYFFFYAWLFVLFVSIILITVYADFIAPLFDKYMPLKDGALKVQIEKMAKSLNFPLKKLYVVVGSKRSSHSNAYMYGI
ncbi:hypothetical protein SNEBB_007401 [Seison nebaliae]|nr:hypothetical protein SNEBB_007401 [Seison nebaliae]